MYFCVFSSLYFFAKNQNMSRHFLALFSRGAPMATVPPSASHVPPPGGSMARNESVHKMDMSHEQRLAEAARLREAGNALFRLGNFGEAEATYEQGASLFTYMNAESVLLPVYAEQNRESCQAAVPLYNNLALCLFRREAWRECADACTEGLDLVPDDRKATLRRGLAHVELDLWDEAEVDFKRVLHLDPRSRETRDVVQHARAAIAHAKRRQDDKDSKALAGCFDKLNAADDGINPDMDGVDGGVGGTTRAGLYDASDVAPPNQAFPTSGRRMEKPTMIINVDDELTEIKDDEEEVKMAQRQDAYNACVRMNMAKQSKVA